MIDAITRWARAQARVVTYGLTGANAWVQLVPADPDRFSLWVTTDSTANVAVAFLQGSVFLPIVTLATTYNFAGWSEDDIGELITYPVWVIAPTGSPSVRGTSVSYLPDRRQTINAILQRELSNPGSL